MKSQTDNHARIFGFRPLLLLVILIAFAYINSLGVYFIWDDYPAIVNNPQIMNFNPANAFKYLYQDAGPCAFKAPMYFRPLQALSYMLDYRIWGMNPFGYHLTSLLLHTINAILVYLLLLCLLKNEFLSFWLSALFGVHPVFTTSVTYISGRADLLSLLFCLATLILFFKRRYALSLFCFILGLFSKEAGVFCLFVLVIADKLVFKYGQGRRNLIYLPYLLALSIWQFLRPASLPGFGPVLDKLRDIPFLILSVLKGLIAYTSLAMMPLQPRMGHSINIISGLRDRWLYLALIFFIILVLLVRRLRKNKLFLLGLAWFYLPLSAQLFFNWFLARRSGQMLLSEHNLYFSYPGLLICFYSLIGPWQLRKARRSLTPVFLALALFYAGLTITLNSYWQDEVRFFERNLKLNRDSAFNFIDYANLGFAYERAENFIRAEESFKSAAKNSSGNPDFYNSLAAFYMRSKNPDKAIEALESSKALDENYYHTYALAGLAYLDKGSKLKARQNFEKALSLNPDDISLKQQIESLGRQ